MTVRNNAASEYRGAVIGSVVLHVAVLIGLVFNFNIFEKDDSIVYAKVIDAVVVDSSVLDALDQENQQKENLKKQQLLQAEKKRQQEAEQLEKEKLEQQRLAEQKKQQEAIRLAEKKRLQEQQTLAEQKRVEDERRLREQAQAAEWEKLQAEERAAAEQARGRELANNMDLYKQAIKQRVDRNWVRPVSAEDWYTCEVSVDQIPGGEVVNVEILKCDGDAIFQRSVMNAVYKSSPLPDPSNPALFDRRIQFTFKVPGE
ncbi:MAG: cell envelope integrity protein TolA [Gammaproteobacteria bacterium]|nr:cell envelope integrity protein TolA [Gammaproteobacteria bacterium]